MVSYVRGFGGSSARRLEASLIGGGPQRPTSGTSTVEDDPASLAKRLKDYFSVDGFLTSLVVSYEDWDSYETYGAMLVGYPLVKRFGKSHVNYMLGVGAGWRRYLQGDAASDRVVWGLRGALGWGLIYFDAAYENAHRFSAEGRVEEGNNLSLGARVQIVF